MKRAGRLLVLAFVGGLTACSAAPGASAIGEAEALDLVRAEVPLFVGVGPREPDTIGQAAWVEQTATDAGWEIVVRIGWGDCPAGCISEHRWTYAVTTAGMVSLIEESGAPLPMGTGLHGTVVAGPTCPVVTDPPDPGCADQPVAGAELVVTTSEGIEVARTTSDADGRFAVQLAPGEYRVEPQPVDGLMGTAEPMAVFVEWGMLIPALVVTYDTGIR